MNGFLYPAAVPLPPLDVGLYRKCQPTSSTLRKPYIEVEIN
jgi:hypothetical protein